MVCRSFFVMSSPFLSLGNVNLAITSCDIVTAHLVRVRVVVMVMMMMMMMMMMVVAVMMIARLVMLNVVKHLYK